MSRQKKDEKENLIENNISSDDYDEDNLKADTIPGEDEWADFSKAPQPKVPNVATSATNLNLSAEDIKRGQEQLAKDAIRTKLGATIAPTPIQVEAHVC